MWENIKNHNVVLNALKSQICLYYTHSFSGPVVYLCFLIFCVFDVLTYVTCLIGERVPSSGKSKNQFLAIAYDLVGSTYFIYSLILNLFPPNLNLYTPNIFLSSSYTLSQPLSCPKLHQSQISGTRNYLYAPKPTTIIQLVSPIVCVPYFVLSLPRKVQ